MLAGGEGGAVVEARAALGAVEVDRRFALGRGGARRERGFGEPRLRRAAAHDEAEVHHLDRGLRIGMVVDPFVRGVEGGGEGFGAPAGDRPPVDRGLDLVGLPAVAHVRGPDEPRFAPEPLLVAEPSEGASFERPGVGVERAEALRVEVDEGGADEVVADVRDQPAVCGEHPRSGRDDGAPDAEVAGEQAAGHRAGAPEGEEGERARVGAVARQQLGDLQVHARDRDPDDALGRLREGEAEGLGEGRDGPLRGPAVEGDRAVAEVPGAEEVQDREGVGEGRALPAASVAGGAGPRPGALRPDLEHPELVDPCDRPAPRADRGDGDGRDVDRELADHLAHPEGGLAVLDHRDVRARAPDVEAQHLRGADPGRRVRRPDDPGRGPREQHRDGVGLAELRGHDPAVRFGDHGSGGDPGVPQGGLERADVRRDPALHVARDGRGHRALVLPDDRPDVGGEGHRRVRGRGPDRVAHGAFVGGVGVGVEEGDHDGVGARRERPPGRRRNLLGVRRGLDAPVPEGPLGDAVDPLARGEGRRTAREEVVGVRDLEARDLEDVLEAAGGEEGERRPPALDDRVHPHGGAVGEVADRVRRPSMPARERRDAVHHLGAGGLGGREGLVGAHRARCLVEDAEVGERPADVDAEAKPGSRPIHIRSAPPPSRLSGRAAGGPPHRPAAPRAPRSRLHRTAFAGGAPAPSVPAARRGRRSERRSSFRPVGTRPALPARRPSPVPMADPRRASRR